MQTFKAESAVYMAWAKNQDLFELEKSSEDNTNITAWRQNPPLASLTTPLKSGFLSFASLSLL